MDVNQVERDASGVFRCRECGFRYALSPAEIAAACEESVVSAVSAANAVPPGLRSARTAPQVWSPNAYCAHLAEATQLIEGRVRRIAAEDRPLLPGYDQDAAAVAGDFDSVPLQESLPRVEAAVARFVALVRELPAEAWSRAGVHEEAGEIRLRDIAHDMPHELRHHAGDLRRIGAELQGGA